MIQNDQAYKIIDTKPLHAEFGWLSFALIMLTRRPANRLFSIVICRAHERGIINSVQLHEILGIWNRMVNGGE